MVCYYIVIIYWYHCCHYYCFMRVVPMLLLCVFASVLLGHMINAVGFVLPRTYIPYTHRNIGFNSFSGSLPESLFQPSLIEMYEFYYIFIVYIIVTIIIITTCYECVVLLHIVVMCYVYY